LYEQYNGFLNIIFIFNGSLLTKVLLKTSPLKGSLVRMRITTN